MSKIGLKLEQKMIDSLEKSGFETLRAQENDKGVDFLAAKGDCVFAIQVKSRPLESYDIISGSTITAGTIQASIRDAPRYQNKELIPVLVSGSVVTDSSEVFGSNLGVIVTDYNKILDRLDTACKKPRK